MMENVSPFWSFCSLPRIVESWRVQENYHESFLQTNSISWSCLKPMEVFVCSIYFFKTANAGTFHSRVEWNINFLEKLLTLFCSSYR